MVINFNEYYRTNLIHSEEWHAGVLMTEDYYSYMKLFEDGFWLSKKHDRADFDFRGFLASLDIDRAKQAYSAEENPPLGADGDFDYQVGHWILLGTQLTLTSVFFLRTVNGHTLKVSKDVHYVITPVGHLRNESGDIVYGALDE